MIPFLGELHVYLIEERRIGPLHPSLPRDVRERYEKVRQDLIGDYSRTEGIEEREEIADRAESLRHLFEELIHCRAGKLVRMAFEEARTGQAALLMGSLPWERDRYRAVVESISQLLEERNRS